MNVAIGALPVARGVTVGATDTLDPNLAFLTMSHAFGASASHQIPMLQVVTVASSELVTW